MDATTSADARALLLAIASQPEEDTPRLAYADWCDEFGAADRAEFIRAGCALAKENVGGWHGDGTDFCWGCFVCDKRGYEESARNYGCKCTGRIRRLLDRERELREKHEARWRAVGTCPSCESRGTEESKVLQRRDWLRCPACDGAGDVGGLTGKWDHLRGHPAGDGTFWRHRVEFARGFVDAVHVGALAEVLEERDEKCERCAGDGKAHGADRPFEWSTDVDYGKCVVCSGRGTVRRLTATPWARAVVAWHPVRAIYPADVEPIETVPGRWFPPATLPHALAEMLVSADPPPHATAQASRDAVAAAVCRLVRRG